MPPLLIGPVFQDLGVQQYENLVLGQNQIIAQAFFLKIDIYTNLMYIYRSDVNVLKKNEAEYSHTDSKNASENDGEVCFALILANKLRHNFLCPK